MHEYRDAQKWLEQALRDAPGNVGVTNLLALVLVEQEDALKRQRGLDLAVANVRAYPQSVEAVSTLGWAYYRLGKLDAAQKTLEAAASTGKASSDTAYYLAHVMAERGRVDEAIKLVEVAMKGAGSFSFRAEAQQWLARLAARSNRTPKLPPPKEPSAPKESAPKEPAEAKEAATTKGPAHAPKAP